MSWSGEDGSSNGSGQEDSSRQESLHNAIMAAAKSARGSGSQMAAAQTIDSALKQWNIQWQDLPQPPFFAPLFGYTTQWQQLAVGTVIDANSRFLGRPVTSQEAQAVAYHVSKKCARETWVAPAVLASTVFLTYRGRESFRFPFYTPKPASFDPSSYPTLARPWIKGQRARLLWHIGRFGAYAFICRFLVGGLIESFAQASYIMGSLSDTRLKGVRETLAQREAAKRKDRKLPPRIPAGEAPNLEGSQTAFDGRGAVGDRSEYEQQQQQQPSSQWPQGNTGPQGGAVQDDDSFLFDDGSPVAPSQRQPSQGASAASAPSAPGQGSAWDRIRQRAKSEEGAWNRAQQQDADGARGHQRTEQQYTYSSNERERAYAKEQAQKEFDAMLERERRGEGNSGGGGRL